MRLTRATDATEAARIAAVEIAAACRTAVHERGLAVIGLSGGETPWRMLQQLRGLDLPWQQLTVVQVDERVAPPGDARRNLTRIEDALVNAGPLPAARLLPMPVEATDLEAAAAAYQQLIEQHSSAPIRLDVVQLGLGADGHTASLVPGDSVLAVTDRDVAIVGPYQGLPRMTLTRPALDRARLQLWLVTGASKAAALHDLLTRRGDAPSISVVRDDALIVADLAAAGPA